METPFEHRLSFTTNIALCTIVHFHGWEKSSREGEKRKEELLIGIDVPMTMKFSKISNIFKLFLSKFKNKIK